MKEIRFGFKNGKFGQRNAARADGRAITALAGTAWVAGRAVAALANTARAD